METQTVSHAISLDTFSSNAVNARIARDPAVDEALQKYLDGQIERILSHRGVNHPFLNAYRTKQLTPTQERHLYLETYYYFLHVPFYICALCTQTRDEAVMRQVLSNVADEFGMNGTKPHSEIFLSFLRQIGISQDDIDSYKPLPSTEALNKGIHALYIQPPFVKALGALFAEETQSAAMVEKYDAGLANQGYSRTVRSFWLMHIQAEVGHSNAVFNCIFPYLQTPQDRKLFEQGIDEYMALLEGYWNGVQRLLEN